MWIKILTGLNNTSLRALTNILFTCFTRKNNKSSFQFNYFGTLNNILVVITILDNGKLYCCPNLDVAQYDSGQTMPTSGAQNSCNYANVNIYTGTYCSKQCNWNNCTLSKQICMFALQHCCQEDECQKKKFAKYLF